MIATCAGMAPRGWGGNPPQCCWLSWSNPDCVGHIPTELYHKKWPTLIFCLIKEVELVKPQSLTNSSWSYLNTDWFKLVKPQYWPTRVAQTSTLTVSGWSNLNNNRLELAKPQHWPTRAGQTSTLSDSSWSSLNIDRLKLVKPQHRPTRVGQIFFTPPPITYPWSHPCTCGKFQRNPNLIMRILIHS